MINPDLIPSSRAGRVWVRHVMQYRTFFLAEWAGNFGEHALYLVAFGYGLGRLVPSIDGISYAQFIGPGLVVSIAMWTSTFESTYGAYNRSFFSPPRPGSGVGGGRSRPTPRQ